MTNYATAARGVVLIALMLFAVALAGALTTGGQGLSSGGSGQVLGAASLLDDPDEGGQ